ncbi:hypothetical protein [Natrinema altunense]|uniref:Uncharacterized protein n=1 Tax=Natrinema altunense TaxID=222984 RepID=A0A482XZ14_9EURY|nr:hypothetical protein [Natrinema altunense]RZH69288.1 hypothetical protein ELS17_07645 [Natrinema altunense]
MSQTAFETIDTMLASVQSDVDDPDLRFKLRTSRQLLRLLHERHEAGRDALEETDLDEATRANLERLGYLE